MTQSNHENYSRYGIVVADSDRSFGIVMTAVLALMSLLNWWHDGHSWRWTGGLAGLFLMFALLCPAALGPLNQLWLRFGLLLHKIVNPVLMALVFFGVVWATGLIMRALGRDLLQLKWNPGAESYWILRRRPGPAPETMKDQF